MGELTMNNYARKVDEMGRVLLPMDIQNSLGIRPGDELAVSVENGVIRMTAAQSRCKICGKVISENRPLCEACVNAVKGW